MKARSAGSEGRMEMLRVARLQVLAEMRGVERLAARAPYELRRLPARALQPDVLAQPVEDRGELARADALIEVGVVLADGGEPLRRVHGAERVVGKVAEEALAPVHVLH